MVIGGITDTIKKVPNSHEIAKAPNLHQSTTLYKKKPEEKTTDASNSRHRRNDISIRMSHHGNVMLLNEN